MDLYKLDKQPMHLQVEGRKVGSSRPLHNSSTRKNNKPFSSYLKEGRSEKKKEEKEKKALSPIEMFAPKPQELCEAGQSGAVSTLYCASASEEAAAAFPAAGEISSVSSYTKEQAELLFLAQKMCDKVMTMEKEAVTYTSIALKTPAFEGVTLQIALYSTAPKQYNIEFFGCNPLQQAQLAAKESLALLHEQAKQAGFQIHQIYAVQEPQEAFASLPFSDREDSSQEKEQQKEDQR